MAKEKCIACGEGEKDGHYVLYGCSHCNKTFCNECIIDHMTTQNVIFEVEL